MYSLDQYENNEAKSLAEDWYYEKTMQERKQEVVKYLSRYVRQDIVNYFADCVASAVQDENHEATILAHHLGLTQSDIHALNENFDDFKDVQIQINYNDYNDCLI